MLRQEAEDKCLGKVSLFGGQTRYPLNHEPPSSLIPLAKDPFILYALTCTIQVNQLIGKYTRHGSYGFMMALGYGRPWQILELDLMIYAITLLMVQKSEMHQIKLLVNTPQYLPRCVIFQVITCI